MVPEIRTTIGTVIHPTNDTNDAVPCSTNSTIPLVYDKLWPTNIAALSKYDYVLSNFSKASLLDPTGLVKKLTAIETIWCTAPEILRNEAYGKPVDIFGYGALLFACSTGIVVGSTPQERTMLINGSWDVPRILDQASSDAQGYWNNLPTDLRDLILSCLAIHPMSRLSADTVANHSYIRTLVINYVPGIISYRISIKLRKR